MADRPIRVRRGTTAEITGLTLLDGEAAWDSTANNLYIGTGAGNIKIGGASGIDSIDDIGDVTITALTDNELLQYDSASGKWINQTLAEVGFVAGPGASTDNAVVRWNGTDGYTLQNSGVTITDGNQIVSPVTTGTAPFSIASVTVNPNLNSDFVDGSHGSAFTLKATLTAKGSIYAASAVDTPAELAVGTNGYVVSALSTETTGLVWATPNNLIKRIVEWQVQIPSEALVAGDDQARMFIPSDLSGWNLTDVDACVNTASTSGLPSIALYNVTDSVDMLTTNVTIDANEKTSYTAATPAVIDATHDDVATGDELRCDLDADGTGTKGLVMILVFTKP